MDAGERILAHVVSVWREADRRVSLGGREGMLILTDSHISFVHKTEAKMRWWQAVVQRQAVALLKSRNVMVRHDGYGEAELARDLENEKNDEIALRDVTEASWEERAWGSVLRLAYRRGGKVERRRFSVVLDWVKYPAKDPSKYMRVDWEPLVEHVRKASGRARRVAAYAIGVGPGDPRMMTRAAAEAISACDVVVGYAGALRTAESLLAKKDVREVTMATQEGVYAEVAGGDARSVGVLFTGDASFSESEVVDRLAEVFGGVTVVPGISAVQVAAARARVPLDRCRVISMHVTSPIGRKKAELARAVIDGECVVLVPRPWPSRPDLEFMPRDVARHLAASGVDTSSVRARVYEDLTLAGERAFDGTVADLASREFSAHLVVVIGDHEADSYMNYQWQWGGQRTGVSTETASS